MPNNNFTQPDCHPISQRSLRKTGEGVVINDGLVTRQVLSNRSDEILKLNVIAGSGAKFGFRAPQAWEHDDESRIAMEFVETSEISSHLYQRYVCGRQAVDEKKCLQMVSDCGRILAIIHRELRAQYLITFDKKTTLTDPRRVVLHGDFGFSNIYLGRNSEIVLFDPFPDFYSTFETWQVGRPSWDLGMFTSCLVGRVAPLGFLSIRARRIPQLIERFVESYNAQADQKVELSDVLDDAALVASSYFRLNTTGIKRRLGIKLWARNLRLVRNLIQVA